ncbi:hypothetical protein BFG57_14590 [Bacillus solimangrovi]|uniref:Uncharacterized protein n=1 Tax=Bacillus solimangrovi TaxID=1305675 RepID=A0A1E5LFT0_9BACI|nr:hypothetical protein BFG57_14590 [Bacillus solimangrovi]
MFAFTLISLLTAVVYFYITINPTLKETMIYFPIDETISFENIQTSLLLLDEKDEDEYVIDWKVSSKSNRNVYLRQDISLLFSDGKLIATLGKWKENTNILSQEKKIKGEDSSHLSALSLHHAEAHYPDDIIKGQQLMSYAQLYIIDSPLQPLESFSTASTTAEKEWKETLDRATAQALKYSWTRLIDTYNIPVKQYKLIPLTSLHQYTDKPLPNKTVAESQRILGQLWEGLYKNYYLGIKKENGTTINPIGSTIPLILFNDTHLIVLIEDINGDPNQLIQYY